MYAFYDCLRSCELNSNSEKSLEEYVENCELRPLKRISMAKIGI